MRKICPNRVKFPLIDWYTPVLHTLHWLPVEQRIEYKLLLLAFKSVNNDGRSYLLYIPSRQLRSSSDTRLLRIPSFHLKSFWTTQILVSGLCSMELSPDLTPSFQLYISLQICSKDASFPILSLPDTVIDVCVYGGGGGGGRGRERENVYVCV